MDPHFADGATGEVAHLGVADMRLLLSSEQTNGALSIGEFTGRAGPWTVPHVHRDLEEVFYVIDGRFRFVCDELVVVAEPGALLMVPRGSPHVFTAETDGKVLVLWTPGGLEQMFLELGRLGGDLTDPSVRAEVAKRYDSMPVAPPAAG
jgi:quercetin dioxygenase-like cupin family protein